MTGAKLVPLDRSDVAPYTVSGRLRAQLVYFMASPGAEGVPELGENEFYFRPEEVGQVLEDGVIHLVSPLDTANMTEVEISEEQETFLGWLQKHDVRHVRVID